MRRTATEDNEATLTRLIRAWDAQHPVTITYTKADTTQTVRTIEIYDIAVSTAGDLLIKAMDRQTGEARTFRLDRLVAYTVHRSAYTVERTEDEDPGKPGAVPSLRFALEAVAGLDTVPLDIDARVALLADTLAA